MTNKLAHPVIGYRSWLPVPDGDGQLMSKLWNPRTQWSRDTNQAECHAYDHHVDDFGAHYITRQGAYIKSGVPSAKCTCGLYAMHSLSECQVYCNYFDGADKLVYGIVKGWGRMQIHPDGWRAQYSEVKAIIASPNMPAARAAAAYYGVPLLYNLSEIDLLASEFGKFCPIELRPIARSPKAEDMFVVTMACTIMTVGLYTGFHIMKRVINGLRR